MTESERVEVARDRAKQIVRELKRSNARAAREGAPVVDDACYQGLELTLERKLLRAV